MKLLLVQQQRKMIRGFRVSVVFLLSAALVVSLPQHNAFAQTQSQRKVVKGHVSNEKGEAVSGASVLIKGTSTGANTDAKGDYTISAANGATLVISYVGYTSKEVRVGANSSVVNVQLDPINNELDQVVVVGYGTQKKKDVTGSVVTVSAATLAEVPTANLISELKGRAAGVDIVSNSSTPGGGGQIRIRGNRSITNSQSSSDGLDQPLLVVDGIPFGGSINDISPDDILSLDILKDASATAIYGSRGSGGVLIVTTRRGKTGKAVTSYNSYFGFSNILSEFKVFSGPEYAAFKLEAAKPSGTSSYGLSVAEQAGLAAGTNTDWQKLIYKTGFTTSNEVSVAGGSETTQYGLGIGYYREDGIIPNQRFERYSLRNSLDHKISNRIKIGISSLSTLTYNNTPGGGGVPGALIKLSPLVAPYNADGSINLFPLVGTTDAAAYVNPLTLITRKDAILARTRRFRTFNSLYGEVTILKDLKYRINVGLDFTQSQSDNYSGPNTYVNTNTSLTAATASVGNAESYVYTIENLLMYDKTFGKHRLTFTGLFSTQKNHDLSSSFSGSNFPADYIQNTNLGLAANPLTTTNDNFSERGLISYMARLNYGFDNRFNLTATVRRDGASVLSPGNQYFTYPALAAAWNVTNEKFMQNNHVFSNLKVRAGWGKTSNQGVAPYSTLGALSTTTYNFGTTSAGNQAGYLVTTLANNSLHWEYTTQWNAGLEFGILKNRITGTIDVYDQRTGDILLPLTLPPSNGAGSTILNAGKTKGHGIEISLGSVNIQSKSGFTWTTDVNFSISREQITQLQSPTAPSDVANGWFIGQPLTVIYDVKKIGIWQTGDPGLATQTSPVPKPGQIRIEDINSVANDGKPDGKITADDRQILGNYQPQWTGGMTNRVAYKGFDLSVVIFARMGMKVLVPYLTDDGGANGFPFFMQSRINQVKVNYWTASNPTNEFPQPDASTDRFNYASTLGYRDGSFIKVRSINFGYTVPSRLLTRAGITSLRVYVSAQNPFILYSPLVKSGLATDPEGNGYGGGVTPQTVGASDLPTGNRQISVNANNPSTRQFTIGLNLKF